MRTILAEFKWKIRSLQTGISRTIKTDIQRDDKWRSEFEIKNASKILEDRTLISEIIDNKVFHQGRKTSLAFLILKIYTAL